MDLTPTEAFAMATMSYQAIVKRLASKMLYIRHDRLRMALKKVIKYGSRTTAFEDLIQERMRQRIVRKVRENRRINYDLRCGRPKTCWNKCADVFGIDHTDHTHMQKRLINIVMFDIIFLSKFGSSYAMLQAIGKKWTVPKSYEPISEAIITTSEGPVVSVTIGARRVLIWRRRGMFTCTKIQGLTRSRAFNLRDYDAGHLDRYVWKKLSVPSTDGGHQSIT